MNSRSIKHNKTGGCWSDVSAPVAITMRRICEPLISAASAKVPLASIATEYGWLNETPAPDLVSVDAKPERERQRNGKLSRKKKRDRKKRKKVNDIKNK